MTLYINPVRRNTQRRAMEEMMRDLDEDYSAMIRFPIDIMADNDGYTIKALLPGVKSEDLDIQIVNEIVTISGTLDADRKEGENYMLAERPSGTFHRVLTLPTPLDSSKVEASLEDGVLTLEIPKTEEAKPRRIKVTQQ
ncbi:MAG: Hsp20/alpha crystallin family protein [Chloroflexota bacterium]|nr:Hsp20/alpha crystallin family protein [Chloroflexota bacterium]